MSEMLLKYCAGLLLMLGMGMTTHVSAETATATDTEEVIVAREILQPKNNQKYLPAPWSEQSRHQSGLYRHYASLKCVD